MLISAVAHSKPIRKYTEGDMSLILQIDFPPHKKSIFKSKNNELRIEFDSEEGTSQLRTREQTLWLRLKRCDRLCHLQIRNLEKWRIVVTDKLPECVLIRS